MFFVDFLPFFVLFSTVSGQEFSFGRCPPFPVVQNFDAKRYTGLWYEYSNYFAIFQLFGKCVTAEYSLLPSYGKNVKIRVVNRSVNEISGNRDSVIGEAVLNDPYEPTGSAELIVNFQNQPAFARSRSTNYNVVATDYDSFSIVYSCSQVAFFKSEFLWVLTRQRFPDPNLIRNIYSKIRHFGLDTRRLVRTDQKNCDPALKRENELDIIDDDSSLSSRNSQLKAQGRDFPGADDSDLKNQSSVYDESQYNFIDEEGPNFKNNGTAAVGHDHPFQTGFESRGPSYWPPAK